MEIRPATAADVPGLQAIYDPHTLSSHTTFHTEPVPAGVWLERLASPHAGDQILVAVDEGRALGAAWSTAFRPRAAYDATRETSVYLADDATGRGIGRGLYDVLLGRLAEVGVHTAVAAVALPNDASVALHRACGFADVGVLCEVGHKLDRWIDVRWFQKML
ncbi:GNAT family N-acetyltransferase [Nocardioides guangzhouensis]|nr:GNAT family N-acetyltransferase [Nocardioides guangzhouensis]